MLGESTAHRAYILEVDRNGEGVTLLEIGVGMHPA